MAVDLAREVALKTLFDINEKGAYSNIALNKQLKEADLKEIDRAFATDLVYGTVKWLLSIDWVIRKYSSIRLKKISPWILNILRMGVYQLLYSTKVPDSAACNESAELAKKYGHKASTGFVNALMRNIAKNKDNIEYPKREIDILKYLSIKYSHPEWMTEKFIRLFGEEFTESLIESNNVIPEFTARANTLKINREELISILASENIQAAAGRYSKDSVIIANPSSITKLESFKKGLFQVQDESSMLVAQILDPKPGELIIDTCSAPGGKATHIAQLMGNTGMVVARDIHEHKIKLIRDAAERLGLNIIKAEVYDASVIDDNYIEKADRVLLDAPCTGLGIIRRKPDIKWSRDISDEKNITELQEKLINAVSKYVKPGGVLVYSTCTITPEENSEIIKSFLKSNTLFCLEDFSESLPGDLKNRVISQGMIQLYQNRDKVDGFFIAKLRRRG